MRTVTNELDDTQVQVAFKDLGIPAPQATQTAQEQPTQQKGKRKGNQSSSDVTTEARKGKSPNPYIELGFKPWMWTPYAGYIFAAASMAHTIVRLQGSPEQIELFSTFVSVFIPVLWVIALVRGSEAGFKATNYLFFSCSILNLFL